MIKKALVSMASKDTLVVISSGKGSYSSSPSSKITPFPDWEDMDPKSWEVLHRMSIKEESLEKKKEEKKKKKATL